MGLSKLRKRRKRRAQANGKSRHRLRAGRTGSVHFKKRASARRA